MGVSIWRLRHHHWEVNRVLVEHEDEAQSTPTWKHSQNILLLAVPASSLVFSVAMMSTVDMLEFSKPKTIAFEFHTFSRPKQGQDSNTPSTKPG